MDGSWIVTDLCHRMVAGGKVLGKQEIEVIRVERGLNNHPNQNVLEGEGAPLQSRWGCPWETRLDLQ